MFCLADHRINLHITGHHMFVCFGAAMEQMVPEEELLSSAIGGRDSGAS